MSSEHQLLFKNDSTLLRLMTLDAHETGLNHHHTQLLETVICVEGEIILTTEDSHEPLLLRPGQQASIAAQVHHCIENRCDVQARYILAQTGGAYDFIPGPRQA